MSSRCIMRFFVQPTALALCFALAGCVSSRGLHPTGTLTDPRSLKAEQSLAAVPLSPTAWPAQDWWIGFGDPQLTALINEALQNNPSLDEVEARARQAQAVADGADAAPKPRADLDNAIARAVLSKKDAPYPPYVSRHFRSA